MRTCQENLSVSEFTCRFEGYIKACAAPDLVDINGISLPLEATVRVEYETDDDEHPETFAERPLAYCVIDVTDVASWSEGSWRLFNPPPESTDLTHLLPPE